MISKEHAQLLNEIVERKLIVNIRTDTLSAVGLNVQLQTIEEGKKYAFAIEHGPASISVAFTSLRGYSRLKSGGLLLMI